MQTDHPVVDAGAWVCHLGRALRVVSFEFFVFPGLMAAIDANYAVSDTDNMPANVVDSGSRMAHVVNWKGKAND